MNLVIVDTECANLTSVRFALERLGIKPTISDDAMLIKNADRVILPGVGTAAAAMRNLENKQLIEPLQSLTQPVLGICLGMQLLTSHSEEGNVNCLNVIPANTQRMQTDALPLPHMGWNNIEPVNDNPLLTDEQSPYCYFVHSFAVAEDQYTIARCHYHQPFAAMIKKDNFIGAQFHPERSGAAGRRILQRFLELPLC
ncbi:imidazole glycerol phosphate synthase subunit HisH [Idiomarina seosinensis]|uniref:imidazole glycerol phosphate synthase subunit HisH n=1 Tax=Idiomarina seosinensis TaxID=281739 RepID=UPI00384C5EB9